jgi:hypothetical protein
MANSKNEANLLRRTLIPLVTIAVVVSALVFGITHIRHLAKSNQERARQERRQRCFDSVKSGESTALVMDSKLLPMLANDVDCQRIVTHLDFASTKIDPVDANAVSMLKNVTSMTFYCTAGTENVLNAAKALPIANLYFEMPDLTPESYLKLKTFSSLKSLHVEHVVTPEWRIRLESELPNVKIGAPFTE